MKLLKIYRPSCAPCVAVDSYLLDKGVVYESINIQESVEVAVKYGIMSTPVVILLDSNDNEIARSTGYSPPQLDELIKQL